MNGVMILLGKAQGWSSVKEAILGTQYMSQISKYDFNKTSEEQVQKAKAEMDKIEKPNAHGKAYAVFGFWASAVI